MNTSNQDYLDRRVFPRHPVRDSSAVMLSPDKVVSFSILDISKSGMAFSYNGIKLESKLQDEAFVDFFGDNGGGAEGLPVRIISDTELDKKNVWLLNEQAGVETPYLMRCGLEFAELSVEQETTLNKYIQSLGMG